MLVLKYVSLKKDIYNVQYYKMIRKKKQQSLEYKRNAKNMRIRLRCYLSKVAFTLEQEAFELDRQVP